MAQLDHAKEIFNTAEAYLKKKLDEHEKADGRQQTDECAKQEDSEVGH